MILHRGLYVGVIVNIIAHVLQHVIHIQAVPGLAHAGVHVVVHPRAVHLRIPRDQCAAERHGGRVGVEAALNLAVRPVIMMILRAVAAVVIQIRGFTVVLPVGAVVAHAVQHQHFVAVRIARHIFLRGKQRARIKAVAVPQLLYAVVANILVFRLLIQHPSKIQSGEHQLVLRIVGVVVYASQLPNAVEIVVVASRRDQPRGIVGVVDVIDILPHPAELLPPRQAHQVTGGVVTHGVDDLVLAINGVRHRQKTMVGVVGEAANLVIVVRVEAGHLPLVIILRA